MGYDGDGLPGVLQGGGGLFVSGVAEVDPVHLKTGKQRHSGVTPGGAVEHRAPKRRDHFCQFVSTVIISLVSLLKLLCYIISRLLKVYRTH